jgi:hypothetical protein
VTVGHPVFDRRNRRSRGAAEPERSQSQRRKEDV